MSNFAIKTIDKQEIAYYTLLLGNVSHLSTATREFDPFLLALSWVSYQGRYIAYCYIYVTF